MKFLFRLEAGGVVFRLYSLEQYSSLKLFDEPSERDGEMQLLPMYRKVLKLDYRSMKSGYGRNAESRDFVRLLPTMSPEYMAFLREAKDEPLVPFYRKLFLVTLLSLSPVINSNLEAKFLLDEPCRFSSTSYFTLFVTKILNRLRGAADFDSKDRSWNFMERIAGYVKKRMDVLASSLFNLVEAEDWAEETTPADMELLYMALHHRDVHLYRLDIEKKIRYTVCLKKNDGTECLLHPCDGVDFFAPNSSPGRLAFHLLETRKGSFSALSPVTASYGKSFRPRLLMESRSVHGSPDTDIPRRFTSAPMGVVPCSQTM
uniref:Mab-21 domain-containing protein n=1 Tax=Steinernema glaseri TaxID=37863 RepID=A0A1I7YL41_9BILA